MMSWPHSVRKSAAALLLAAAMVGGAGVSAQADTDTTTTIDRALAQMGQSVGATEAPTKAVSVEDDHATINLGKEKLTLSMEATPQSEFRVRAEGVQGLSVLESGQNTAQYHFRIPSSTFFRPTGDGGYDVVSTVGAGTLSLAHVHPPWAVDASGRRLPTKYSLDRGTLTQIVDTSKAKFPVVADPLLTVGIANAPWGPGLYINLFGWQIKAFGSAVVAAGGVGAIAGCVLGKLPGTAGLILRFICTSAGIPSIPALINFIVEANRTSPLKGTTCYQTLVSGSKPFVPTAASNCR